MDMTSEKGMNVIFALYRLASLIPFPFEVVLIVRRTFKKKEREARDMD